MSSRALAASLVSGFFTATLLLAAGAGPALAAQGACSQPVTNGARPTATDCLFILKAAVGSEVCSPECICAPKGSLPITATDALVCLKFAVGQPVELACPCSSTTVTTITSTTVTSITTTTSTTSTTLSPTTTTGPTTTTTSTTTTIVLPATTTTTTTTTLDPCTIDSAICTTDACTCVDSPGVDYHIAHSSGTITGPVGAEVHVNINAQQGGTIDCGGWTRIGASATTGCDDIGCCRHEAGQPDTVTWSVFEVIDLPCFCPSSPSPGSLVHNLVAQCFYPPSTVIERDQTSSGCP
jgi:hypothetical protein